MIMKMPCPKCRLILVSDVLTNVAVPRCPSCFGVWFDVGLFIKYRRMIEFGLESKSGSYLGFKANEPKELLRCPKCQRSTLEPETIVGGYSAMKCSLCYGVFIGEDALSNMRRKADLAYKKLNEREGGF
jgi:Zn-finger nucleic acid-binding protein